MKQIALDIGLASPPSFANFFAGPNEATLKHLALWAGNSLRSPVPTYLWGEAGSGKTHLLKAVSESLREQGAAVGWLDASVLELRDGRIEEAVAAGRARELVQWGLGRLTPEEQLILTLAELEERPMREIAELTGWSEANVKVRAFRARQNLKRILENSHER